MSDNDVIVWSKNHSLIWSDFKSESNPALFEDAYSVIKYEFTWTVTSEKIENDVFFLIENIQLSADFHCNLSWVRSSQVNANLLKHEQGHFDLAELLKRENMKKIQQIFYGRKFPTRGQNEEQRKQYAKEDSGKMIIKEVEKLEQLLSKRRKEYDEQTNFGQNLSEQLKYDSQFHDLKS